MNIRFNNNNNNININILILMLGLIKKKLHGIDNDLENGTWPIKLVYNYMLISNPMTYSFIYLSYFFIPLLYLFIYHTSFINMVFVPWYLAHRIHLNKSFFFSFCKYKILWSKYKKRFYLFTIPLVYLYFYLFTTTSWVSIKRCFIYLLYLYFIYIFIY